MAQILAGTDVDGAYYQAAGLATLGRFKAVIGGTTSSFRLYSGTTGNVKLAIYADSGGEPGALLWSYNTSQATGGTGWKTFTGGTPNTIINKGGFYWLGGIADAANVIMVLGSGNPWRSKTVTYSTFSWPDPAGSGWSAGNYTFNVSIYGVANISTFFPFFK